MRTRERTWTRLLAVLMSIALVAVACGSDDDDTDDEEAAATTTTEAAGHDSTEPADDDTATQDGDQSAEETVTENKALVPEGAEWGETRELEVDGTTYTAHGALVPDGQLPQGWETRYEGNADWTVIDVSYGSIRQEAAATFADGLCMLEVVQTGRAGFWVWWVFATAAACDGVWPLSLLDQLSAAPPPNVE